LFAGMADRIADLLARTVCIRQAFHAGVVARIANRAISGRRAIQILEAFDTGIGG
jgi:hypothetical protein